MSDIQDGVLVFGEINLDVYVKLTSDATYRLESAAPATINFELGGNTWNIARTLLKLGKHVRFICTSSRDDVSISILEKKYSLDYLNIEFIPAVTTLAPRFVAADESDKPILRAIDVPTQEKPSQRQLEFLSNLLEENYNKGFRVAILASSIEPEIMKHIVQESIRLNMQLVGTVSSAPTVSRFVPCLTNLSLLILNLSEAQSLAYFLGITNRAGEQLAQTLSRHVSQIVVTTGADGLYAYSKDGARFRCTPPELGKEFVNDLGAGDAFAAFMVDAYIRYQTWLSYESIAWATTGAVLVCQTDSHLIEGIDSIRAAKLYEHIRQVNSY